MKKSLYLPCKMQTVFLEVSLHIAGLSEHQTTNGTNIVPVNQNLFFLKL